MTLVAALSGLNGVVMFADTEETVAGYSKRIVEKLSVYDLPNMPFRFAIGGATTNAPYVDMLQSEIASTLSSINRYDLQEITNTLASTLTDFYSKHVWPRTDKPEMEYLVTVQPLPDGDPKIFHISETAINILPSPHFPVTTTHNKSIGLGGYLADYLFKSILGGSESMAQLAAAAVYIAKEVRENIEGVGQVDRIILLDSNGDYDELMPRDILAIEENFDSLNEIMGSVFEEITNTDDDFGRFLYGDVTPIIREMRDTQVKIFDQWREQKDSRQEMILRMYAKRKVS